MVLVYGWFRFVCRLCLVFCLVVNAGGLLVLVRFLWACGFAAVFFSVWLFGLLVVGFGCVALLIVLWLCGYLLCYAV